MGNPFVICKHVSKHGPFEFLEASDRTIVQQ